MKQKTKKPIIITVGNIKGGVGKTRIATGLATMFAHDKKKVLLVDSDIQGSSLTYRKRRGDLADELEKDPLVKKELNLSYDRIPLFQCFQLRSTTIDKDLRDYDHDIIIVDAGGRDDEEFRASVFAADFLIIPLKPAMDDYDQTLVTIGIWRKMLRTGKKIKAALVQNQLIPNKIVRFYATFNELVEKVVKDNDLKQFPPILQRLPYIESASFGLNVNETSEEGYNKAAEEFTAFYKEVSRWVATKS